MISHRRTLGVFAALGACVFAPTALLAQKFERPPVYSVAKMRGLQARGPNYTIKNPIRSDGLLRIYVLSTPYGEFTVQGDQFLSMRLKELRVLTALEKVSSSQAFSKALVAAGLSPLKYTGKLITRPVQTIGETLGGVGALFNRFGAGVANAGKTRDNALASLLGVTSQKRELAARYGVDPYTDFVPLAAKLTQLAEAAAAGGLAVTGAMFAIPGAAGVVVSNLSTANKLGDIGIEELARSYTAAQIFELNRHRLAALGVDRRLIEALIANRNYTPIDMAAMVAALDSMTAVADRDIFLVRAANVNARAIAYFMRRQAELVAAYYTPTRSFVRFVSLGGYPFNMTRDNRIIGVMPIDAMSWTPSSARALQDGTADRRRVAPGARAELRITGQSTRLARQQLKRLGWKVVENVRP
jgi:hypothetical protein